MTAALAASWTATLRYARAAADHFWCTVEERCPGLLSKRESGVFVAALGRRPAVATPLGLGPPRDTGLELDSASRADLLLVAGVTGLAPLRAAAVTRSPDRSPPGGSGSCRVRVPPLGRRGYRSDDVNALLRRLAHEMGERSRQLDLVREENRRLKQALRAWQADCAATRQRGWDAVEIGQS